MVSEGSPFVCDCEKLYMNGLQQEVASRRSQQDKREAYIEADRIYQKQKVEQITEKEAEQERQTVCKVNPRIRQMQLGRRPGLQLHRRA